MATDPPLDSVVIYIAPSEDVGMLKAQPGFDRDILVFGHSDSLKAMEAIVARKPHLVVIHRSFMELSRGAAIINQLRTDPHYSQPQIRVLDQSADYISLVLRRAKKRLPPNTAMPGEPLADSYRGTRVVDRVTIDREVEVRLEGEQSQLIDLSPTGAQLVSSSSMRPGQRVPVSLAPEKQDIIKLVGMVAWPPSSRPSARAAPAIELAWPS